MRKARIEYGRLVEDALRTVVRDVLRDAAGEDGISAPHHFYITFKTGHPDVDIPDFLHQRYPTEMTIVLQYQYWSLEVAEDHFGVTLSFNDEPHRLIVPFTAIKVFADPGVEFGLQFTLDSDDDGSESEAETGAMTHPAARITPDNNTVAPTALPRPQPRPVGDDDDETGENGKSAEIVALDRFRKK